MPNHQNKVINFDEKIKKCLSFHKKSINISLRFV